MSKLFGCFGIVIVMIIAGGYFLFVRPVGPEIYFKYKTQFYRYNGGEIEFYLVNDNPNNGGDSYFFKVSLDAGPTFVPTCNLSDFDWELKRIVDGNIMFSTASQTGTLTQKGYFENKINGSVFKGKSGFGLGEYDFEVILTFNANNGCGIGVDNLVIKKSMRLKYKRMNYFDVMMSV